MQIARRVFMGAVFALPLLAQCVVNIRLVVADGVGAVWPT